MLPPVPHDEKGFTLLEFLVAIVILMVGLLGLLEAVNVGIRQNTGNKLRNDAIMLADQVMANQRVRPFANISTSQGSQTVNTGAAVVTYSVNKVVTPLTATSANVRVDISWRERGQTKQHSLSTVITNETVN
jgi:type IV pilus assembly protein PilV